MNFIQCEKDQNWMKIALKYAFYAKEKGEIPIGAILVLKNCIIGVGWNNSIEKNDPTAHAEIMAFRNAGKNTKNYRFQNATLYVTLQPCIMCCGAIIHSRIKRLVFGASYQKVNNQYSSKNILLTLENKYNFNIEKDIMKNECAGILSDFFQSKRKNNK